VPAADAGTEIAQRLDLENPSRISLRPLPGGGEGSPRELHVAVNGVEELAHVECPERRREQLVGLRPLRPVERAVGDVGVGKLAHRGAEKLLRLVAEADVADELPRVGVDDAAEVGGDTRTGELAGVQALAGEREGDAVGGRLPDDLAHGHPAPLPSVLHRASVSIPSGWRATVPPLPS